jgi:hypothetical protein
MAGTARGKSTAKFVTGDKSLYSESNLGEVIVTSRGQ